MNSFAIKGTIIYTEEKDCILSAENSYAVCEDGICKGVFSSLPERYSGLPVYDYGNNLIIPGMTDLHVHAPQYTVCGYAMDMELMPWLEAYIFPEEARYRDMEYAVQAYSQFVRDLKQSPTTRVCAFGTLHIEETAELMHQLEEAGFCGAVGKVSMDRNAPKNLLEKHGKENIQKWLELCRFEHIKPILTPRFLPACSDELMTAIGEIQKETGLPLQSHLSENPAEIQMVAELCPESLFYGDAYDRFGTFGTAGKTIMAHCVYSGDEEISLMKRNGVFAAHCAESNFNLASGIAPARKFLEAGLNMGLGTDIGGSGSVSMFRSVKEAIIASKMYWRLIDEDKKPLKFSEAFYLATKGGGSFWGKTGSFEEGYEFDAVIIDDSMQRVHERMTPENRLERVINADDCRVVTDKYIQGKKQK